MILILLLIFICKPILAITEQPFVVAGKNRLITACPFNSLFGERICTNRNASLNVQFCYGMPARDLGAIVTGTGAVNIDATSNVAVLNTCVGTGAASAAIISKRKIISVPFSETYLYAMLSFGTENTANTEQWVGLFDADNGFAIGSKNGRFSILHRCAGSVDAIIDANDFNCDILNGADASKLALNLGKVNVFRISNGWLGCTPIIFEILTPEGSWCTFHIIRQTNSTSQAGLRSPILPVCAQVTRINGTSNVAMNVVALEAGIIGDGKSGACKKVFSIAQNGITVRNNQSMPILTIKNMTTFKGKPNLVDIHLLFMEFGAEGGDARFSMIKNGTLTGASYVNVNDESVIQKDVAATAISGGAPLWYNYVSKYQGSKEYYLKNNGIVISLMPGETLTFVAYGITTSPEADISILWEELM